MQGYSGDFHLYNTVCYVMQAKNIDKIDKTQISLLLDKKYMQLFKKI